MTLPASRQSAANLRQSTLFSCIGEGSDTVHKVFAECYLALKGRFSVFVIVSPNNKRQSALLMGSRDFPSSNQLAALR